MADKSSHVNSNLPSEENEKIVPQSEEGEESEEGLSSSEEQEELDLKTKTGFQKLVARKDKEIFTLKKELDENTLRLSKLERAERDKKLAEMSEAERYKTQAEDYAAKYAKAEIKVFVSQEISKRNLTSVPQVLLNDIIERPWLLSPIARHLEQGATWEETIEAVKQYLPSYLDSLVTPNTGNAPVTETPSNSESQEEESTEMETERSQPVATKKRIWTRAEIAELGKDPKKYLEHQAEISQAFAEGRIR